MERLVREELERWDSETSFSPSGRGASPSSGNSARGARSRSRPGSGQNEAVSIFKGNNSKGN
jgi:polycystin 2